MIETYQNGHFLDDWGRAKMDIFCPKGTDLFRNLGG